MMGIFNSLIKKHLPPRYVYRYSLPKFMHRRVTYSQCGEDMLISSVLDMVCGFGPKKYLDIGANHPFYLSNTALLYDLGGSGFLVEPDPYLAKLLRKKRPRDKVLECGVHFCGEEKADFYSIDPPTLNTFSSSEMERYVTLGHKLINTKLVDLRDINSILNLSGQLDFMNLDIEGLDKAVLEMVDFSKYRPVCICVETLTYENKKQPKKILDIIDLMIERNYILYADTYINSIFIDKNKWDAQWQK